MKQVVIKTGREKSIRNRHPWVFQSAIQKAPVTVRPGELVTLVTPKEEFLAAGYINPRSQIAVRVLEWDQNVPVDDFWWDKKITASVERRRPLAGSSSTNAFRLVYGEADFLPGLVVDQYAGFLVVQFLTAGAEAVRDTVLKILSDRLKPEGVVERSDADVRSLEGLEMRSGVLSGVTPPEDLEIFENWNRFYVDILKGQKTGFFLDQRDNRKALAALSAGRTVLDCFSYTGGFSISCLRGGALSVTAVDSSAPALASLKKNLELNRKYDLKNSDLFTVNGDVFELLRKFRDGGRLFDMIVMDPPKLAPTKNSLDKALRAYKDLSLHALKICKPGGMIVPFSCSGGVSLDDLTKTVAWAGKDAGRDIQIVKTLTQAEDHPVRISYPESGYLKGLVCLVI